MPGAAPRSEEVFGDGSAYVGGSSEHLAASSAHLVTSSAHSNKQPSGSNLDKSQSEQRDADGRLISAQLDAPVVDSLDALLSSYRSHLEELAEVSRTRGKVAPEIMRKAILALCNGQYVTGTCIATLVGRDPDALRQQHLKPLVNERRLRLAFPTAPTHAMQAYRASED